MSRLDQTSDTWRREMFARETDEVVLGLCRISGGGLARPIRVVNNIEPIGSDWDGGAASFVGTSIDIGADTINIPAGHTFKTGDGPVILQTTNVPDGLALNTLYYVATAGGNKIKLYTQPDLDAASLVDLQEAVGPTHKLVDGYLPLAFSFDFPSEGDGNRGIRVRLDNTDQFVIDAIRSLTGRPQMELLAILASDTNVAELGPYVASAIDVTWGANWIETELFPNDHDRRTPPFSFTPETFPHAF